MVAPLSEVPKEGSLVFPLFSLIKLYLASLPLASSYSHVAVSSVICAQNIYFSGRIHSMDFYLYLHVSEGVPVRKKDEILD